MLHLDELMVTGLELPWPCRGHSCRLRLVDRQTTLIRRCTLVRHHTTTRQGLNSITALLWRQLSPTGLDGVLPTCGGCRLLLHSTNSGVAGPSSHLHSLALVLAAHYQGELRQVGQIGWGDGGHGVVAS